METFTPQHTSQLLLCEDGIRECKEWLRSCAGPSSVLIIDTARAGNGISTLIRLACQEENVEPLVLATNIPKLNMFLTDAAGSRFTVDFRKKVLVIDPLDAVFSESSCVTGITDYFKHGSPLPVLVAGKTLRSSFSKLHEMLPSKIYTIKTITFPEIDADKALAYLETVRKQLGRLTPVHTFWHGDLRNALTAIDADIPGGVKEDRCDGVDAVWKALFDKSLTIRDSIRMHDGDVSMITAGTHENYPKTGQPIETCARLADIYSLADITEEIMYKTQHWELADITTALAAGGPVAYIDKELAAKHDRIDLSKFGTIWSRGNNQRTKEKKVREIRRAMVERRLYGSSHIESIAMIRHMMMTRIDAGNATGTKQNRLQTWDAMLDVLGDLPDTVVLDIMRLWKSGYNQAHHGSLKKRRMQL